MIAWYTNQARHGESSHYRKVLLMPRAAEDLVPSESAMSRNRGPSLGGALSRCANYTAPEQMVAVFKQMLAEPKQKLTVRKQILRTLARLPGLHVSCR